jgi:predicted HicB family RNase H-like nuclease
MESGGMTAKIGSMPNQPATKVSAFRIPLDLKAAAAAKAKSEGKTLTDVIVEALTRYVKRSK